MKTKKYIKKAIIIIVILCAVVTGLYFYFSPKPINVEVETVEKSSFEDSFKETGIVQTGKNINSISAVSGKVLRINIKKNDIIKKGDIIAVIDSKDYSYEINSHKSTIDGYKAKIKEITETENYDKKDYTYNIEELKIELEKVKNSKSKSNIENTLTPSPTTYIETLLVDMNICKNEAELAEDTYNKNTILYEIGALTKTELDDSKNNYQKATLDFTNAQNKYNDAKNRLAKLEESGLNSDEVNTQFYNTISVDFDQEIKEIQTKISALESKIQNDYSTSATKQLNAQISAEENTIKQLEDKIKDCTITATCDGRVIDLPIEHQTEISEGDIVASIKNEDRFVIEVNVRTDKVPYLKVGDKVEIIQKLKDSDLTYDGNISSIYNYAEKSISALGLDEYKVKVVIDMEKVSTLNDGYETDIKFFTAKDDNIISIPNSALFKIDDNYYVFVIKDGKAVQQKVEVGHKANIRTEITSGIDEGEIVISVANTEGLAEGVAVNADNQ